MHKWFCPHEGCRHLNNEADKHCMNPECRRGRPANARMFTEAEAEKIAVPAQRFAWLFLGNGDRPIGPEYSDRFPDEVGPALVEVNPVVVDENVGGTVEGDEPPDEILDGEQVVVEEDGAETSPEIDGVKTGEVAPESEGEETLDPDGFVHETLEIPEKPAGEGDDATTLEGTSTPEGPAEVKEGAPVCDENCEGCPQAPPIITGEAAAGGGEVAPGTGKIPERCTWSGIAREMEQPEKPAEEGGGAATPEGTAQLEGVPEEITTALGCGQECEHCPAPEIATDLPEDPDGSGEQPTTWGKVKEEFGAQEGQGEPAESPGEVAATSEGETTDVAEKPSDEDEQAAGDNSQAVLGDELQIYPDGALTGESNTKGSEPPVVTEPVEGGETLPETDDTPTAEPGPATGPRTTQVPTPVSPTLVSTPRPGAHVHEEELTLPFRPGTSNAQTNPVPKSVPGKEASGGEVPKSEFEDTGIPPKVTTLVPENDAKRTPAPEGEDAELAVDGSQAVEPGAPEVKPHDATLDYQVAIGAGFTDEALVSQPESDTDGPTLLRSDEELEPESDVLIHDDVTDGTGTVESLVGMVTGQPGTTQEETETTLPFQEGSARLPTDETSTSEKASTAPVQEGGSEEANPHGSDKHEETPPVAKQSKQGEGHFFSAGQSDPSHAQVNTKPQVQTPGTGDDRSEMHH